MQLRNLGLTLVVGCLLASPALAQYGGVLQSAETMDRGVFKLMIAPVMVFGKDGADDEIGVTARGGYGFTNRFDAELTLGFFENVTFIGADGELWIVQSPDPDAGLDLSLTGGLHWTFAGDSGLDAMGLELTPILSGHLTESLELYGALATNFDSYQDAPPGVDDSITRMHLVPGLEYRLSEDADLVGEVGIGLNDDSSTYAGVGLAFYLR